MKTFNRLALARALHARLDLPLDRAKGVVDTTLEVLADALTEGQKIEFRQFGVMEVVVRRPKIGRNPKKPENAYQIPARRAVRFRACQHLFHRLNP